MHAGVSKKIILALTGASGLAYGLRLLECLVNASHSISLLISPAACAVAAHEMDLVLPKQAHKLADFLTDYTKAKEGQITVFGELEWSSALASGSHQIKKMVICPASSGTLSAIAQGASNNLIERAADVMLKEQRQLIMVPRETPLSVIHLENMLKLAKLGVKIIPAMPGFYHQPKTVSALIDFMVARILDHLDIEHELVPRWGD